MATSMKRFFSQVLRVSLGMLVFELGTVTDSLSQETTKLTSHQLNVISGKNCASTNTVLFISDRNGGNIDLWRMQTDGTNPVNLTNDTNLEIEAAFSPNGDKIAYVVIEGEDASKLYVMNVDGTNKNLVVDGQGEIMDISWDTSGNKIAYELGKDIGDNWEENIWVVSANGTQGMQLTTDGMSYDFCWSPDGNKIVYQGSMQTQNGTQSGILIMDADGNNKTFLVDGYSPVWSPNGKWIAFYTYPDGIFLINPAGTNTIRLTQKIGYDLQWSPDS